MWSWTVLWAYCVLAVVLVTAAVTDVRWGKILNVVTYPAIAAGLLGHTLLELGHDWLLRKLGVEVYSIGLVGSLAGFAIGFLPLLVAWLAGGIGGGDAKLMGAVGALTGVEFTLSAMFYGLVIAALMAIFVMVRRRITVSTLGRIWRFLYLSFTPAKGADPSTPESPKVAFGLALCIGSAAALVQALLRQKFLFEVTG